MAALERELSVRGIKTYLTREPGGTPLGDEIRQMILRKEGPAPKARTELLLYEASRAQHVDEVILPKLKQGIWVLSDRFAASSVAFQAGGREIALDKVHWLNHFATDGLEADLTVLLDLSVEESKKRREGRSQKTGESADRIESEADAFHEKVRQGFLSQAQASPKWLVLDARLSPQDLFAELLAELKKRGFIK